MRDKLRKIYAGVLWIASDLMLIWYGYWLHEKYKAGERLDYFKPPRSPVSGKSARSMKTTTADAADC